jgi:nucleolar GTP-binding protein
VDVIKYEDIKESDREMIENLGKAAGVQVMPMSNVSEEGVTKVKNTACDKLLQARVDAKLSGKRVDDVMNRLTVAMPTPRDTRTREPSIPPSVIAARESAMTVDGKAVAKPKRRTEKDLMIENGGAGVYSQVSIHTHTHTHTHTFLFTHTHKNYHTQTHTSCLSYKHTHTHTPTHTHTQDMRKLYLLKDDQWKWDAMPEIWEGKNVVDFVDPDIEARLQQLEEEEEVCIYTHTHTYMHENVCGDRHRDAYTGLSIDSLTYIHTHTYTHTSSFTH